MAPSGGPAKRKRGDRTWSGDSVDRQRPSPHRPENLNLAQHGQGQGQNQGYGNPSESRGRGGRRSSRGGRGGGSSLRSPTIGLSRQGQGQVRSPTTAQPMDPPAYANHRPPQNNIEHSATSLATELEEPSLPRPTPQPYLYEFLRDTTVKDWDNVGRQEVVDKGTQARDAEDYMGLSSLYQEVLRSGLDGRLSPEEAGRTIKDTVGDMDAPDEHTMLEGDVLIPPPFDARKVFLDTLSIMTNSDHEHPSLRPLVISTGIPAPMMRQYLEWPLMVSLGLVRNTFYKMAVRKQTGLVYRQSNYNLLREESEGYSKLITELFTTSNSPRATSEIVEETFEKVKAMIGAFDMDVGRVLDVILDVFAAVVIRQNQFFVKFLRASSWWPNDAEAGKLLPYQRLGGLPKWALPGASSQALPVDDGSEAMLIEERDKAFWSRVEEVGIKAYFEIGRQLMTEIDFEKTLPDDTSLIDEERKMDVYRDLKWIRATGTLPPKGNMVAAQLLGFKLRFYSSKARKAHESVPEILIYLTALLIKIGFISLRDLYPHLWPDDDSMESIRQKRTEDKAKAEKAKRPGGAENNALATAGALSDDTLPASIRSRDADAKAGTPARDDLEKLVSENMEDKETLPEPREQKVQLLKSLLAIGALPESLYLLGRFPWLMDGPDLQPFISRIVHQSLSIVYAPLEPPPLFSNFEPTPAPDTDQTALPKGHVRLGEYSIRKSLKWAHLDQPDKDGADYRFYWDEWLDNIPCCRSIDDVFLLCGSFLNLLGVKIGLDPPLITKLAKIGVDSLSKDQSEVNKSRWLDLCKRLLVPALSLTSHEPGVVNEVWQILKQYPRSIRYSVYAEWYQGQISRLPDMKSAFELTKAQTKDALKRISKNNTKHMARVLAKVAYSSPGIVINTAIAQIEAYDNLIQVVVGCARYFTELGYDVMTWCLLTALGQKGRNRVQADGMLTSRWLGALALFTGMVFKAYDRTDPTPILQYVAEQLRQDNSTDLIVLEQITTNMGGIVSDASFNDAQIQAMGGGKLLQLQTMLQLHDTRKSTNRGNKRLMKSLIQARLAGELLISIAQERKTCVFKVPEEDAHLKLLGNLFDEIHRVLTQYLDFLRYNLSIEDFKSSVPNVASLIGDFGLEPEVAFWINREGIASEMATADRTALELNERKKFEVVTTKILKDNTGDIDMGDGHEIPNDAVTERIPNGVEDPMDVENTAKANVEKANSGEAHTGEASPLSPAELSSNEEAGPWHPILRDLMEKIGSALPEEALEHLGIAFYVTFWQLSLFDIHIPAKAYEDEIDRSKRSVVQITNDRSDLSMLGARKKESLKKEAVKLQEDLLTENKNHLKSYTQTRSRLQKEKEQWFKNVNRQYNQLNVALLEQCFFPRMRLSPIDSFYCFKMLKYLHSSGTPNFRTMGFLDQVFSEHKLTSLIFLCTTKEAENYSRFLADVLKDLHRWHGDKALYEKEAFGVKRDLPGFAKAVDSEGKPSNFLTFEDFRRLLYKWHRLLGSAMKTCFSGGEYMHIRNAILTLRAVHPVFPAINWIGREQVNLVTKLGESESREDLKLAATSLLGSLKKREKQWVLPQAFYVSETPTTGLNGAKSTPSTPQPSKAQPVLQKALNATATEFKPSTTSNDTSRPQTQDKFDVEDGEIEDAKMTDIAAQLSVEEAQPPNQEPQKGQSDSDSTSTPASRPASVPPAPISKLPDSESQHTQSNSDISKPRETDTMSTDVRKDSKVDLEPARPEISRREGDRGLGQGVPGPRSQHNLPNRPEPRPFRQSDARIPPRPPVASEERRDHRDLRPPEYGRTYRMNDQERERGFAREDFHGSRTLDRHERGILDRERDYHEPHPPNERDSTPRIPDDRNNRPPSRDTRGPVREPEYHERTLRSNPQDQFSSRTEQPHSSRDDHGGPPRSNINPERAALIEDADRDVVTNGDRDKRGESTRSDFEDRRNRLSRPTSPRRQNEIRLPRERREERAPEPVNPVQDRIPAGPRDRQVRPIAASENGASSDTSREMRPTLLPPPRFEPNQGRLNNDARPQRPPEPAHERSNAPPEIPSGPRGRNPSGRGGRGNYAVQPHINTQLPAQSPHPSAPERQPPTGPSAGRTLRNSSHIDHSSSTAASTPSTSTVQPAEAVGIHPDRLKALQSPVDSQSVSPQTSGPRAPAILAPSPTTMAMPPSGPRSSQISPTAPQPPRGPPSGPGYGGSDRRSDKRFADLQQTLAGGPDRGGMGTSIRGRGARQPGQTHSPRSSAPPTPGADPYPPAANGRPDLFARNEAPRGPPPPYQGPQRPEDDQRGPARRRLDQDGTSDLRPSRHSSSRTHSVERDHERRSGHEDSRVPGGGSGGRRDEHRDGRDHEHPRDRRTDAVPGSTTREERHESKEHRESSRRPREEGDPANLKRPPRRSQRDEFDAGQDRRPPPPQHAPAPPMQVALEEDRRWGGRELRDSRGRGSDREERDRDRDRERDRREGGNGDGMGSLRKRGRPPTGEEGDRDGGSGRGGGPGMRPDKRPRRGPP